MFLRLRRLKKEASLSRQSTCSQCCEATTATESCAAPIDRLQPPQVEVTRMPQVPALKTRPTRPVAASSSSASMSSPSLFFNFYSITALLLLLQLISTGPGLSLAQDYTDMGFFDEYTTRCLDDQCDCDKQSSAVICSDSDFDSLPSRQLVSLPFAVQRLTLTRNRFTVNGVLGPENFTGLANLLEELVLQECGISRLKRGIFHSMPRLIYLDLSMNRIRNLARRQFAVLPSLEVLVLSGNRNLRLDEDSFQGSTASELALDECGLTDLPKSLQSYPAGLRRLYLQDNRLQTVPHTLKPMFDDFEDVRLRGNRWHCDIRLAWLLEIFHRRRDAFSDDPICESPENMFGRRFSTVSPREDAMKVQLPMPRLPPESSEDYFGFEFGIPTTVAMTTPTTTTPTTTTTTSPTTTTTTRLTTTTLLHLLRFDSTVVPLSKDTAEELASSEWQIDYPTREDEIRAHEYKAAYELRERLRNRQGSNFGKTEKPFKNANPIAVFTRPESDEVDYDPNYFPAESDKSYGVEDNTRKVVIDSVNARAIATAPPTQRRDGGGAGGGGGYGHANNRRMEPSSSAAAPRVTNSNVVAFVVCLISVILNCHPCYSTAA